MRCVYFDCSQGASAELMLGALVAAQDGAHAGAVPVVYRLPGGVRVRCAHAAAGQVVGRCVECEFPGELSPDEELSHAGFEEFMRAAVPEGAATELMVRMSSALGVAIEQSRPSARRALRSVPGVTRRMAAVLAALATRLAELDIERVYYSPVNAGGARDDELPSPAVLRLAGQGGVRIYMTPGAGELLTLDGAAVLAALGECGCPALTPEGDGVGVSGERRMYALLGERVPEADAAAQPGRCPDAAPEADAPAGRVATPEQDAAPEAAPVNEQYEAPDNAPVNRQCEAPDAAPVNGQGEASDAAPVNGQGEAPDAAPVNGQGEASDTAPVNTERVALIECNIDDMSPEQLAYACQLLMERGALDVWQTPIIMKKGRMAAQLSVLCAEDALEHLAQEVLCQTSTLGVRIAHYERRVLPRSQRTVDTCFGQVRVKLAPGKAAPEYEDCRAAAARSGAPIADVYAAARGAVDGLK